MIAILSKKRCGADDKNLLFQWFKNFIIIILNFLLRIINKAVIEITVAFRLNLLHIMNDSLTQASLQTTLKYGQ